MPDLNPNLQYDICEKFCKVIEQDFQVAQIKKNEFKSHYDNGEFYQYSAAWDSKHIVKVEKGKTARVLYTMQEMQDGGELF